MFASIRNAVIFSMLFIIGSLTTGCGQKGALFMPVKKAVPAVPAPVTAPIETPGPTSIPTAPNLISPASK